MGKLRVYAVEVVNGSEGTVVGKMNGGWIIEYDVPVLVLGREMRRFRCPEALVQEIPSDQPTIIDQ